MRVSFDERWLYSCLIDFIVFGDFGCLQCSFAKDLPRSIEVFELSLLRLSSDSGLALVLRAMARNETKRFPLEQLRPVWGLLDLTELPSFT